MLKVENLSISFPQKEQYITVVQNLSFELKENQILGVVGESGSGKSISSLAVLGLLPKNAELEGKILFDKLSLLELSEKDFQNLRGKSIAMIFSR